MNIGARWLTNFIPSLPLWLWVSACMRRCLTWVGNCFALEYELGVSRDRS
jgi:hypothetical protein